MADAYRKISDFSKTTAFNDTDLLLVSQNGSTKVVEGSKVKSYATEAGKEAAKLTKAETDSNGKLIITLADGTEFDCGQVVGTSITGASIDSNYHLILTLSNGNTVDAGYCRGEAGSSSGGDMLVSDYDSTGAVKKAGGITSYVKTYTQYFIQPQSSDATPTTSISLRYQSFKKWVNTGIVMCAMGFTCKYTGDDGFTILEFNLGSSIPGYSGSSSTMLCCPSGQVRVAGTEVPCSITLNAAGELLITNLTSDPTNHAFFKDDAIMVDISFSYYV